MTIKPFKFNTNAFYYSDIKNFKEKEILNYVGKAEAIPVTYLPDISKFPIFYQKKQPACVGHAGAWLKMYLDYFDVNEIRDYSPRFLYALSKSKDNMQNIEGTNPKIMLNILKDIGICDEDLFENIVDLSKEEYIDINKIPKEAYENAESRIIKSYVEVSKDWNELKREIYQYKAILLLIDIGDEWWTDSDGNITWSESKIMPLDKQSNNVSGHEIVAYGYDNNYIYFVNSFSDAWSRKGIGYFTKNYSQHIRVAHAAVDLPDNVVQDLLNKRKTLMIQLISTLQKYIGVLKLKLDDYLKRS